VRLRELLDAAGVAVESVSGLSDDLDVELQGLASDSRQVHEGDLFVCVKGATVDGHSYAREAVAQGAFAVLASDPLPGGDEGLGAPVFYVRDTTDALARAAASFYDLPSTKLRTVGITGTNGKTTTAHLVRAVLEEAGGKAGLVGTVGYEVGGIKLTAGGEPWEPEEEDPNAARVCTDPCMLAPYVGRYEVPNTTPDALQLQQILAGVVAEGGDSCVMEVSSHALAQGRVSQVDYDVAVFTNLTHDHLDYHGDFESYREAKGLLFSRLDDPSRQRAVVNLDDPEAEFFLAKAGDVPVVTYSLTDPKADVSASNVQYSLFETEFDVQTPEGTVDILTPLVGQFNVQNVLAAVATGIAMGVDLETIKEGVEGVLGVPGRLELIDIGQPFAVVVDYAHTPDALENVLKTLKDVGAKRIITLFGCGGDRDKTKRPKMGKIAHEMSDVVFVTNDNPRNEDCHAIVADIVEGFADQAYWDPRVVGVNIKFLQCMFNFPEVWHRDIMTLQDCVQRYVIVDRNTAIRAAVAMAEPGDAVVLAGKGHEDYIEVWDEKFWFDDRAEARHVLHVLRGMNEKADEMGVDIPIDFSHLPWSDVAKPVFSRELGVQGVRRRFSQKGLSRRQQQKKRKEREAAAGGDDEDEDDFDDDDDDDDDDDFFFDDEEEDLGSAIDRDDE